MLGGVLLVFTLYGKVTDKEGNDEDTTEKTMVIACDAGFAA